MKLNKSNTVKIRNVTFYLCISQFKQRDESNSTPANNRNGLHHAMIKRHTTLERNFDFTVKMLGMRIMLSLEGRPRRIEVRNNHPLVYNNYSPVFL